MNTEMTSRGMTGSDVGPGSGTIPHDASTAATGIAVPEILPATTLSPQQQVLRRYGADSLETMTAPQLREALDDLLSGHLLPGGIAAAPSKYEIETGLIELGAALNDISRNFKQLERNFYLAAFGRYDG